MQPLPSSFRLLPGQCHGHGLPRSRSSIFLAVAAALFLLLALCYAATPTDAFGFGRAPSAMHSGFRQPHHATSSPGLFDFGSSGLWADSDDLLLSLLRPHRPVQKPAQSLWHTPRQQQQPSPRSLHQAQLRQLAMQNERHEAHIAALQQQLAQQRNLLQQMMGEKSAAPKSDLPAPSKPTQPQQVQQPTQPRRVPVEVQHQKAAPSTAAAPAAAPVPQQQSRYVIARNPDNSLVVKRVPVQAVETQKQQPMTAPSCRTRPQPQPQQRPQQPQQQSRPQPTRQCHRPVPVKPQQVPIQRQQPPVETVTAANTNPEPQLTPSRIPPTQAPAQSVPVSQQQKTITTSVPVTTTPVASPAVTSEADDDSPVLTAVEHPTHWDVSLPLPGVSAAYVHAEIRGKFVVMFGERHYEDKAVLLPEEVGRIGRYGVVRRVWKMPQAPADPAQRIDVQSAEARYDQSAEVLHVRLFKSGFLPAGQSGNVRVAGPTIHVLVKTEGVAPRRERVVLPPQPSPLDIDTDEHDEEQQHVESAAETGAAPELPVSNLTRAPPASDYAPTPAVASESASARPMALQGASA